MIPTQDYLWSLATSAECTPYLSQLHGSQFLNVDLQTWEAVSLLFCLMVLYSTYSIEYSSTPSDRWRVVSVNDYWLKGSVQLSLIALAMKCTGALSIEFRLRRLCWIMLNSPQSLVIRNHGSPNWKFWNLFALNSSIPPIAWGDSLQHSSCFKLSLCRLYHWHPQQFIVCYLNMPLERRIYFCLFKMNIKVYFALPQ